MYECTYSYFVRSVFILPEKKLIYTKLGNVPTTTSKKRGKIFSLFYRIKTLR